MIIKTKALVLRNTAYGDHAVISKMYTREFGLRSYMINGVRRPKSKISMAALQPLNLLELEAYEKSNKGIQRIKELKCQPLLLDIFQDFRKRGVAMFMIELLNTCIVAEDCEYELYDFIEKVILDLEKTEKVSNFPVQFMVEFSRQLGIEPQADYSEETPYLDLETGMHIAAQHNNCADADVSRVIDLLRDKDKNAHLSLSSDLRKRTLNTLILYYQQHIMHNRSFRSMDILSEVMEAWHAV